MVTLTINHTDYHDSGFDMRNVPLEGVFDWYPVVASSTLIRFEPFTDPFGWSDVFSFTGTGFDFEGIFAPYDDRDWLNVAYGTLTSITFFSGEQSMFSITGLSFSATILGDYISDREETMLVNALFTGNDQIIGWDGDDYLLGRAGHDVIKGMGGRDAIFGGVGNDTLNGGLGSDDLRGGAGTDSFIFATTLSATANVDRLGDFNHLADTVRLNDGNFAAIGALGALGSARFFTGTAAHDASDRVIYTKSTGQIFYDRDGNGTAAKVLFATVAAGTTIDHTDFLVF